MAINYIEKGQGLHAAINLAKHQLYEVDGVWKSDNDAAVQAIIDSYDPLQPAKDKKWKEIQAVRDTKTVGGVRVGANIFHSDLPSRIQQLGLVLMGANVPANLMWKTVGGSFVQMTPTLALQIFGATAASDQAIFAAAEVHKAAAWALPTAEAVNAYDFTAGWPQL